MYEIQAISGFTASTVHTPSLDVNGRYMYLCICVVHDVMLNVCINY